MSTRYMHLADAKIHYEMKGDGYPVVLIHAGIVHMGMWDEQMEVFAKKYRTIRYDIRGWGNSVEQEATFSHYDDLRSLLNHLHVEQAVLVGASVGGNIAIELALEYPELVKALVLAGSGLGGYEFKYQGYERELETSRKAYASGDMALASEYAARIWVDGRRRSSEKVSTSVRQKALEMIRHTYELPDEGGDVRQLEPPAIHRLGEIDQPVLILLGENDQQDIRDIGRLLQNSLALTETVIINNVAHFPNMEKPQEFNKIVLTFLARQFSE